MLHFPNSKINLGLHITCKRPDGFHDLESVFYPLPLHDALEIIIADVSSFETFGAVIPGNPASNLVLKAYELLKQDHPQIAPVKIALLKKVPMGAGLGGGSADAAEALKMLNILFSLRLSDELLTAYALKLGSDCPFFIKNIPAFATGRGEILESVNLDLKQYHFVIVKPTIHISTAWAFSQIKPQPAMNSLTEIIAGPIETWKDRLHNDFEEPIFKTYPEIANIKKILYDAGALYSAMSGSGSAVYGIFKDAVQADQFKIPGNGTEIFVC